MRKRYLWLIAGMLLSSTLFAQQADKEVQDLLARKRQENLREAVTGYRIQIYYGLSEAKARSIQNNFMTLFPDIPVRLFYSQPEWKVHVGNFRTKLEAERALKQIREEFASAFILKTKINVAVEP